MTDKPISLTEPPEGYNDWLAELKNRIQSAQQRATLAVNRELVLLYWQIGHDILARQAAQGWGSRVIDRLAHDLRTAFPNMKGFSPRNLKYMRAFAEAWPDAEFVQAVLAQKSKDKVVAEYALDDKTQPMGIAEYKLQQALPEALETNLPSIEQIERELQGEEE